jgi:hypothetical protein
MTPSSDFQRENDASGAFVDPDQCRSYRRRIILGTAELLYMCALSVGTLSLGTRTRQNSTQSRVRKTLLVFRGICGVGTYDLRLSAIGCRCCGRKLESGCPRPRGYWWTNAHGMGMGLAIARNIIEMHGGSICPSGQASGGATFQVRLPLAKSGRD